MEVVLAQVVAIEQDPTFVRIVETSEKFHQRGLSCIILFDQCEDFAGVQREAKMAHGLADDLASTLLLATDKKILAAPAMNVRMWR